MLTRRSWQRTREVAAGARARSRDPAREALARFTQVGASLGSRVLAVAPALILVACAAIIGLSLGRRLFSAAQPVASVPPVSSAPIHAPSPIRVQVNARPWAMIRVDGVDVGPTPLGHLELAPGMHVFEARFPDGSVLRRRVEIGPTRRYVSLALG